jgi:hypothetical protein
MLLLLLVTLISVGKPFFLMQFSVLKQLKGCEKSAINVLASDV